VEVLVTSSEAGAGAAMTELSRALHWKIKWGLAGEGQPGRTLIDSAVRPFPAKVISHWHGSRNCATPSVQFLRV
jgi:hypothetical protein